MQNLPTYKRACEILDKHLSERAKALTSLERYVDGTQYAGLPDWFSGKKPLWERAPCIVYPIVRTAIDSNADLLLGDWRFPTVKADGLQGEDSDTFEGTVAAIVQQGRLKAAAREVFCAAQGCGSACAVFGLRGGRLFIDTVLARWCEPVLDAEGAVTSLEIKYPYLTIQRIGGEQQVVCMLYRRTIDAVGDVTYLPAKAPEDGTDPTWTKDSTKTFSHGLGFCPVVWYAHMRGCQVFNDYDGRAIHEHLTDEIRALDFALSQRHRAALYAGDPQWTEIGVEPGYNPTGSGGRKAEVPASVYGRPGETFSGAYRSEPTGLSKARKKSPGDVWQYGGDAQKIKVQLHALPGDALTSLDNHAKDLRSKISEAMGVVFVDPDSLPNESRLSGRALESFKAPQLNKVDCYRSDFGDRFLLSALGMLMRIALEKDLQIDGLDLLRSVIAKEKHWSWHSPTLHLVWGDYFRPSGEEEELIIRGACEAKAAGIATTKTLVQRLSSILGIKDVESYMADLEEEQAKNDARAADKMKLEASLAPKPAPPGMKAKK